LKSLREIGIRHRLGASRDRLDNILVAGAAAQIAFELLADDIIAEVVTPAMDEIDGGHDHARCAKAALQAVVLTERLPYRVQRRRVGRKALADPDLVSP